ncbi:MAG: hypothetical protein ACJAS1_006370 [Oleiphilaceae bacterium]
MLSADFTVLAAGIDTLDDTLDYFFNDEFLNTALAGINLQGDDSIISLTLNDLLTLDIADLAVVDANGELVDNNSLNIALGIDDHTGIS